MANAGALQEQLDLLRAAYVARLADRLRHIDETWARLLKNAWDGEAFKELHRCVHSLAGSGSTFGFPALGDAARTVEVFLKSILQDAPVPTASQRSQISVLLAELMAIAAHTTTDGVEVGRLEVARLESTSPVGSIARFSENRLIFLLERDLALVRSLAQQLRYFSYDVHAFRDTDELRKAVLQAPPVALIAEAVAGDKHLIGAPSLMALRHEFQHEHETALPVLFISGADDLTTRLQAVRAGGTAYFTKPIEIDRMLDELAVITANQASDPLRILILDHEVALSALYGFLIRRSGMLTRVVNHPDDLWPALIDFQPDAILMGMQLPSCSALELATAIRQQEAFMSLPIIFLSSDPNQSRRALALRVSGDDFLAKPIQPDHLTAAVINSAQMARSLRDCTTYDSLTGLANHTTMTSQLNIEVARAYRQHSPLAFARIDIDDFKSVNAKHGPLTGDRVLKRLSHLLRQRLRRTDIIGRYGSDEFGVILGGADSSTAVKILEEIRTAFAHIQHQDASFSGADSSNANSCGAGFSVSLSCGVAVLPPCPDAVCLANIAATALAQAKANGRGSVMLARRT